jgi:DNA-binding PadR family transcriptional regulator
MRVEYKHVDYKYLRDLNEIFGYRGDAHIIIGLATAPSLRYSELARAITEHTGERLSDTEINRCLPRLEAHGLICGEGPKRHKIYRLTRQGRDKAALLSFIFDALERRDDEPPPDTD